MNFEHDDAKLREILVNGVSDSMVENFGPTGFTETIDLEPYMNKGAKQYAEHVAKPLVARIAELEKEVDSQHKTICQALAHVRGEGIDENECIALIEESKARIEAIKRTD